MPDRNGTVTIALKYQKTQTLLQNQSEAKSLGKLLIVLFTPPWQSENTDTVCEFAKAAVEEGHEVTVFCDIDAVYNLMATQILSGQTTPASKMAELVEMGVLIHACAESARLRGINPQTDLMKGAITTSLGRCAELMESHDRIISFG